VGRKKTNSSPSVTTVQLNMMAGMTTIVPLCRKLTSQEANTPAIICRLPGTAEARPAAVVLGLIKPEQLS